MTLRMTNWPVAAALWALAYGLLALHWTAGGGGFPFGSADPDPGIDKGLSILGGVHQASAAPVIAGCALAAAVLAGLLAGHRRSSASDGTSSGDAGSNSDGASNSDGDAGGSRFGGGTGFALETAAWTVALFLTVVLPDYRPLVAIGHVPVLLAGKPFGWPEGVSIASQVPWPVVNQGILMAGGVLFALAALSHRRARRDACATCGRHPGDRDPARWGVTAVWIAAAVPVVYAVTRWAWALGIPLGFSAAELRDMNREMPGIWWGGAALATMGLIGSVLVFGLIRPWGERFPRWIPVLRGRRVPIALAIVPALVVAMVVTSAGLMFGRVLYLDPDPGKLAMMGPGLLWPLWGAALAVAALAYRIRRRGACARCAPAI